MLLFLATCVYNHVLYNHLSPCTAVEVCDQPMVVGPCEAEIPSWYYNSESGECEMFTYGGCGGNNNRFATQEACQLRCGDCKIQYQCNIIHAITHTVSFQTAKLRTCM